MSDSDLPSTMVVCEYSAASPSGVRFTKRPPPITVSSPRPGTDFLVEAALGCLEDPELLLGDYSLIGIQEKII